MNRPLKVLFVEDVEDDVMLIVRELKHGGFEPTFKRVDNPKDLEKALYMETWDIILSDYSMPHFNGIAALKLVQRANQNIPFILISGTIGEDIAVTAMKAGANDYIMKSNLTRLVPAINRELQEAKERCALSEAERKIEHLASFPMLNINPILEVDFTGKITYYNNAATKFIEKIGMGNDLTLFLPNDIDDMITILKQQWEAQLYREIEIKNFTFAENIHLVPKFNVVRIYTTDITGRKQSAKKIERLASFPKLNLDPIIEVDYSGAVTFYNTAATKFLKKAGLGKDLSKLAPKDFEDVLKLLRQQTETPLYREIEIEGRTLSQNIHLVPEFEVARIYSKDITERKQLENEVSKGQKLESLGILAGGIAHDFNNLLTVILGNTTMAKMDVKPKDEICNSLDAIENAAMQAKNLTQQLLTFSKGGAPVKKVASISELATDSTSFALRGTNVKSEIIFPDDLMQVEMDEGQINQVINNLVINAVQAMPNGGIIKITGANIGEDEIEHLQILQKTKYVMLSFNDNGDGIKKENLANIFDPFYTTKENGNGLGLATSYSIVKKHDGLITVESELDKGTTFHIYLPASTKETVAKKHETKENIAGAGKILVMDDDKAIQETTKKILCLIGYDVAIAENGKETIELYKNAKEINKPFDAVLIDLIIPAAMGGEETIKKLREIDPDVKAIVCSGYSNSQTIANFKQFGFKDFIIKPFRMQELNDVLQRVINLKPCPTN